MVSKSQEYKRASSVFVYKKKGFFTPDFPFHIIRYVHQNTREVPMHRHEFIELVYVWNGSATHNVGGKRSVLRKGDVFILSRRMKHQYLITPPEPLEIVNCLFLPTLINPHLSSLADMKSFIDFGYIQPLIYPHKHRLRLSGMEDIKVRGIFQDMLDEYSSQPEGWQGMIRAKLVELLIGLSRSYKTLTVEEPQLNKTIRRHREGIFRAIRYLEEYYTEEIKLEKIAETAYLSKSHFSELFKNVTGKTFVEYLRDIRLNKAAGMLKDTDGQITEICYRSGFNSLSYFERSFRKSFGLSPAQFRKKAK